MAELYVKPGNRQRGWNDPPQFSYGLQQQQAPRGGGTKRGLLTRRAAPHGEAPAGEAPPQPPLQGTESVASSAGLPAFPPKSVGLPPPGLPAPSLKADAAKPLTPEAEDDCSVEDILCPLNKALDNCRRSVQKQVCDDIKKRLTILEQMWTQGKLSTPVRRGMRILTQELKSQHWDAADDIHRSLIVDHVTEVSQWIVGVKRLIAETRNLPMVDNEQQTETSLEPEHLQD
ncbi:steroid receptor RNA activator 1 [Tiliqua scincoides]|uniref:steroid receptor RNA activator 1 n=1 Tax=Tiliqua scincoides TaxID=71010 RepID=UPI00346298CA